MGQDLLGNMPAASGSIIAEHLIVHDTRSLRTGREVFPGAKNAVSLFLCFGHVISLKVLFLDSSTDLYHLVRRIFRAAWSKHA